MWAHNDFMHSVTHVRRKAPGPLDAADGPAEVGPQTERTNWVASRLDLPTIGSTLLNEHGIHWVVQGHAVVPTCDSLHRWRSGDIQPQEDLYPVISSATFSPNLAEFLRAIDRCTTKTFAMLDTMPGRRHDGHVPGGNFTDSVCNPTCNIVFLDALRVHESVIAHELGHAWVQYVDECEDLRTMRDANEPQRMRLVGFVQSFVLDLKVNDLLRRKGFDMRPIDEDRDASLRQLALALRRGYTPKHPREEVFMALLVADKMVEEGSGRSNELARVNQSLDIIRDAGAPLARLAAQFAESSGRHGHDSHAAVIATVDDCLVSAFEYCGDRIDLDGALVAVNPEEPDIDKFPDWMPQLRPRTKAVVGKYMARNDITSDWPQCLKPSITGRARVHFVSPGGERSLQMPLNERIGPPNRYSDLPEDIAAVLALKHLNQTGSYQLHGGPPFQTGDLHPLLELVPRRPPSCAPEPAARSGLQGPLVPIGAWPARPYMAGLGRFLTEAALAERLGGEHPYGYALDNPATYTDPSGDRPDQDVVPGPPIYIGPPGHESDPAFWHSTCLPTHHPCATYPGGPCAYARSIGDDKMSDGGLAGGGVICCEGKAYACVWHVGGVPGLYNCAFRHEERHVQDPGGCPTTGYARQKRVAPDSECDPTLIEINCLVGTRSKNCGNNADCLKRYHDRICDLCKYLDDQNCPKPHRCSYC
jgi:hypothetical protein